MSKKSVKIFFTKKRKMFWYRINLTEEVDEKNLRKAKVDALNHKDGPIPLLRYTERNPEWILLFDHIRKGQIHPEDIKHMYRRDLEYMSGMTSNPPGINPVEAAKLRENVTRASLELVRRNTIRTSLISAIIGGAIGTISTIIAS